MSSKSTVQHAPTSPNPRHVPIDQMDFGLLVEECRSLVRHVSSGLLSFGAGESNNHARVVKSIFERDFAKACAEGDGFGLYVAISAIRDELQRHNVVFIGEKGHADSARILLYRTRLKALGFDAKAPKHSQPTLKPNLVSSGTAVPVASRQPVGSA